MGRSEINEEEVERAYIALTNSKVSERLVVPKSLQKVVSGQ